MLQSPLPLSPPAPVGSPLVSSGVIIVHVVCSVVNLEDGVSDSPQQMNRCYPFGSREEFKPSYPHALLCLCMGWDLAETEPRALLGYQWETGHWAWSSSKDVVELGCVSVTLKKEPET